MTGRIVPRLGAISGLLYFVVIVAGSSFGSTDNARRIELVGMLFFLPFLGYLWSVLRRAEGADGWLSMTALGAGLAAFIVKMRAPRRCWLRTTRRRARASTTRSSA